MTVKSNFASLKREEPDVIVQIMNRFNQDPTPNKIDVSIGVYKSEDGPYIFPTVKKAKDYFYENDPGHNYHNMAGIPEYVKGARRTIFGSEEGKIASLQTISGTGSLHMAISFLKEAGHSNFYIGTPSWSNYVPMVQRNGGKVNYYNHYDKKTRGVDFPLLESALTSAPEKSVFILQACCHNPTGADFSKDQWKQICRIVKERDLITLFDAAYLGFSSGDKDIDAWPIRYFYEQELEFLVCQSFSKNMGLYGERVGCLHVVANDSDIVLNAQSTLVAIFRAECSFGPAFGARIAARIMNTEELKKEWDEEVKAITKRLEFIRGKVYQKFVELETPGYWEHVTKQKGLFWYSGLTPDQTEQLISEHHVYVIPNGRVNIAGLGTKDIDSFCKAVDSVVRG